MIIKQTQKYVKKILDIITDICKIYRRLAEASLKVQKYLWFIGALSDKIINVKCIP